MFATNFLPKPKKPVIEAEYELVEISSEENIRLMESIKTRIERIRDGQEATSVSQVSGWRARFV